MSSSGVPDPPPPYSPPGAPEPPPYTPGGAKTNDYELLEGTAITQPPPPPTLDYGTSPPNIADTGQYPPGAVPYNPANPEPHPISTSTTLLITRERKPPTFFFLSVITCLCFSPLFGIIAIIFSALSDSAWHSGDPETARRYSQVAVSLSIFGIFLSIFVLILVFATGAVRIHG